MRVRELFEEADHDDDDGPLGRMIAKQTKIQKNVDTIQDLFKRADGWKEEAVNYADGVGFMVKKARVGRVSLYASERGNRYAAYLNNPRGKLLQKVEGSDLDKFLADMKKAEFWKQGEMSKDEKVTIETEIIRIFRPLRKETPRTAGGMTPDQAHNVQTKLNTWAFGFRVGVVPDREGDTGHLEQMTTMIEKMVEGFKKNPRLNYLGFIMGSKQFKRADIQTNLKTGLKDAVGKTQKIRFIFDGTPD